MTNVTFLSAQMSSKQGFKRFRERAIMVMLKECDQLDKGAFPGKPVVEPIHLNDLTDLEIKAAMAVVSLIKEKKDVESSKAGYVQMGAPKKDTYNQKNPLHLPLFPTKDYFPLL